MLGDPVAVRFQSLFDTCWEKRAVNLGCLGTLPLLVSLRPTERVVRVLFSNTALFYNPLFVHRGNHLGLVRMLSWTAYDNFEIFIGTLYFHIKLANKMGLIQCSDSGECGHFISHQYFAICGVLFVVSTSQNPESSADRSFAFTTSISCCSARCVPSVD